MLFNIDKILHQILHMPTKPFGDVDVIFCGYFYQAEPIRDSWIFDQPKLHGQNVPYTLWQDNVECFQLPLVSRPCTVMVPPFDPFRDAHET